MGLALSCDKCPTAATGSVINLSDALVLRMVEGIEVPQEVQAVIGEETDWVEKLKCLDDAHSNAYGLTVEQIDELMKRVEDRTRARTLKNYCPADIIKSCYKYNSKCTLRCKKEVDQFIDCLDAKRLQRLRVIVDTAKAKKELAEREARAIRKAR